MKTVSPQRVVTQTSGFGAAVRVIALMGFGLPYFFSFAPATVLPASSLSTNSLQTNSLQTTSLPFSSFFFSSVAAQEALTEPQRYSYKIVNRYPSDMAAFTQGLLFNEGVLFRGTGKRGASTLSRIELETGKTLDEVSLSSRYFGEGIEVVGDRLFQLTWQSHVVFEYDKNTLERRATHYNPTEGWGLAYGNDTLYLSDGSDELHLVDPTSFAFTGKLRVTLNSQPVSNLNELEFINGEIWANVWQTDFIVRISPESGIVTGLIDLSGLSERTARGGAEAVLNGIAYDEENARLFVTGKYWATLYEIELIEQ